MRTKIVCRKKCPPPLIQAQVEALCVSAAKETLLLAQTHASPPSYSHNGKLHAHARDKFGLPLCLDKHEPLWITKRCEFLRKLSGQDRNLLLTGDPLFRFDPVVYDCCFFA